MIELPLRIHPKTVLGLATAEIAAIAQHILVGFFTSEASGVIPALMPSFMLALFVLVGIMTAHVYMSFGVEGSVYLKLKSLEDEDGYLGPEDWSRSAGTVVTALVSGQVLNTVAFLGVPLSLIVMLLLLIPIFFGLYGFYNWVLHNM